MQCLGESGLKMKIIMWSVLSGDFDTHLTPEQCFDNVQAHLMPGAIITFHDSRKASHRLRYALPEVLKKMAEKGLVGKGL
jgi:peptidoglycan/xylan/chitin deacetylase (PgdA/CDA1 family)